MLKQIIVMRKDLNMRKGKMIAQGAHASLKATLDNMSDQRVIEWLSGAFTKIAVSVDSLEELNHVASAAKDRSLIVAEIHDNGTTEFNGNKTFTCIAVGPDTPENLSEVTGHLKLL